MSNKGGDGDGGGAAAAAAPPEVGGSGKRRTRGGDSSQGTKAKGAGGEAPSTPPNPQDFIPLVKGELREYQLEGVKVRGKRGRLTPPCGRSIRL